jgi:hypothetical protein
MHQFFHPRRADCKAEAAPGPPRFAKGICCQRFLEAWRSGAPCCQGNDDQDGAGIASICCHLSIFPAAGRSSTSL